MRLGIGLVMALDAVVDLKLLILEQLFHDTCTGVMNSAIQPLSSEQFV